ncbi:type 1 glutamine amidotransferase domain-containing protein [Pseudomonas sp. BN414]|uniref:type 1 glutamine amidotransferase domain-containing protein n=1 Tax=Pseudomonas sp. BN414 TaxID=2567888 RepID=UPI002454EA67|nr:type 1 glutamine amidotransferase domain-containing protein [Pseudomonas sp. BN414]MDH4567320.1 type 1 glutamine amidotransferase domain-containing protein [Pseudomonas sp. BN414]
MRVVFILSSAETLPPDRKIGCWLEELLAPYYLLLDHGAQIAIATPRGGAAPIDPVSVEALQGAALMQRYRDDTELSERLQNTMRIEQVSPSDFDAVIYPGGYSPMLDLRTDPASIDLISNMLHDDKLVGTICHGAAVLLEVTDPQGHPLVRNRSLTAFTDSEEEAVGARNAVPYLVESELRSQGAMFFAAPDWQRNVLVDGNMITGQNPASALGVGEEIIRLLATK